MNPLTDDEAALVYAVQRCGSAAYPIAKVGKKNHWAIGPFRSWQGFPILYKTKRAATEQFERWHSLALERFAAMRQENPNVILTAVGIRGLE
jgi:hypothetical protein